MRLASSFRRIIVFPFAAMLLAGCGAEPGSTDEDIAPPADHPLDTGGAIEPAWRLAASMNEARAAHTATLLTDGRVLVTGGYGNGSYFSRASAELFDPITGAWTVLPPMATPRGHHTATLLADGRVLVAGGYKGSSIGAEAVPAGAVEIYDPAGGGFVAADPMTISRGFHTATRLQDGRVLVTGGFNGQTFDSTAEVFDPASNTWATVGSMAYPRGAHVAVLLPDGRVLIAGGYSGSTVLSTAEIYDPSTQSFAPASSMENPRHRNEAVGLQDGRVLVSGQRTEVTLPPEIYDPASDAWSTADEGVAATGGLALLPKGGVLSTGGVKIGDPATLKSAEVYDPLQNTWSPTGPMASGRYEHTSTLLSDGRVLVSGGFSVAGYVEVTESAELFQQKLPGDACDADLPGECESRACTGGICGCASVDDCPSGLVCDLSHECIEPPPHSRGTCTITSGPSGGGARGWNGISGLLLAACAWAWRRRRRAANGDPKNG